MKISVIQSIMENQVWKYFSYICVAVYYDDKGGVIKYVRLKWAFLNFDFFFEETFNKILRKYNAYKPNTILNMSNLKEKIVRYLVRYVFVK